MIYNFSARNNLESLRINVREKHEIFYWTHTLAISEIRLREAVKLVGPVVKDIKNYLNRSAA